jgi:hypothetical protein
MWRETIMNNVAPTHTRTLVRSPAGLVTDFSLEADRSATEDGHQ